MKAILKTAKPELDLNYEATFNSLANVNIRRKLIPELQKSLKPNYRPSVTQLNRWLSSIHKSRRSRMKLKNSGKINEDNRRVHANNRSNDVCKLLQWQFFRLLH